MKKNTGNKIFRSGFIGLIGRTNVGKSTLINKILERNVVITSDKAQTTRNRINCIYNNKNYQAVFVDCPGFFKPRNLLGKKLNEIIYGVISDVDVVVVVTDISGGIGKGDYYVFEQVGKLHKPVFLLLNKTDLLKDCRKEHLPEIIYDLKKQFEFFIEIIPASALTGENIPFFVDKISGILPEGPKYYPDEMITDMPVSMMVSEIVREKLSQSLFEELPHSVSVEVDSLTRTQTRAGEPITKIECSIYVEKKSHKGIIIGKSGSLLKKTGELARKEIENLTGSKVFIQLWVKVLENWTKNEQFINKLGYM